MMDRRFAVHVLRSAGLGVAFILSLLPTGCMFVTDAATRLGKEVVAQAVALQGTPVLERSFEHAPRSWPEGYSGDYTVTFQESLRHPTSGGSLLIGCEGSPNFRDRGYTYGTTCHLSAVRVSKALRVEKPAGAVLRDTLRKEGRFIEVVGIE